VGAPSGTVTFLFTDIEGSTSLWETASDVMPAALARHDEIVRGAIDAHGGYVFSTMGDGMAAAFGRAADGIAAAVAAQVALAGVEWPAGLDIRVRMGLHTGEAVEHHGDYFGGPVNRTARLMAAAQGGQVVVSEATAALVAGTPGLGLIDLGPYRLRGLVGSSRVFGVEAEGLGWVDRPLATVEAKRGNLPRAATEWFGPVGELKQWLAELAPRRLVTLTGPGGVGKTRAALEIGALSADDFPDGVWLVELAPLQDLEGVPAAAATALGVPSQAGLNNTDALTAWLEGRRLLLIVDNCEHVLDAAAALVGKVAAACETVTILATSREPLGVVGEQVVPVACRELLDAVELFCDRARLADPSAELAGSDRETVAEICARLDGIPLAIELAAARVRSLTPAELLARLDDRFKMLRSAQRDRFERHRTLQATVDWSYQLLSQQERVLFDRLSVFPGDFDLAAAEAVCSDDGDLQGGDVFDLLDGLVAKSLVIAQRSGPATRYRMLETLRQYGQGRLGERGESAELRQRHLGHYVSLAELAYRRWASPRQLDGITIFNREWDNLRAAHTTAIDTSDVDKAERLVQATYWSALGAARFGEYLEWSQRTIDLNRSLGRPCSLVYGYAAMATLLAGDNERGEELATEGLAGADPDDPGSQYCWNSLAMSGIFSGQIDRAAATVAALMAGLAAATDPIVAFQTAIVLMHVTRATDPPAAKGYLDRAGRAATTIGAPLFLASHMYMEGELLMAGGQPDIAGAAERYRGALALARNTAPVLVATIMARQLQLVDVLEDDQADQACREAIAAGYETGYGHQLAYAIAATARYLDFRGNSQAAGVIVGYLEVHHAGLLTQWGSVNQESGVGRTLREISASSNPDWKARGAAMSRTDWVDYTLNALPTY
jgi:predicted ATPase/class 3 adenylate cyclase